MELTALFQEWLITFEKTQSATGYKETVALLLLSRIESRIAATPAEGLRGIVVAMCGAPSVHPHAWGGVERCREQSRFGHSRAVLNLNANLALARVNGSGKSNSA